MDEKHYYDMQDATENEEETAESVLELCNCTAVLLREIGMKEIKQKALACTYNLALKSSDLTNWESVNRAIIKRWSMSGLKRIKEMAWSGKCFT